MTATKDCTLNWCGGLGPQIDITTTDKLVGRVACVWSNTEQESNNDLLFGFTVFRLNKEGLVFSELRFPFTSRSVVNLLRSHAPFNVIFDAVLDCDPPDEVRDVIDRIQF